MRRGFNVNSFIWCLFVSYFIFLLTNGIGNLKYSEKKDLNFIQDKYEDIQIKYDYLIKNMTFGDIEENNREILYLEEMKEEILESVNREGEFWLVDLKNLIRQKEELLLNNFFDRDYTFQKDINYLKLRNEIDEYNFYYNLKQKPIDYVESLFIRYFTFIFNSGIHQFFLTCIILSICFIKMNSINHVYSGFFKTSFIIILPVVLIQILNLIIWIVVDGKVDMFYPVRVVDNFKVKYGNLENMFFDGVMPFYKIFIYTFLVECIYILFVVGIMRIIDLVCDSDCFRVISIGSFLLGMLGLKFTKYSGVSFLSYGKFFDVMRGYEFVYRGEEFFNVTFFLILLLFIMILIGFIYMYKRYILNNKYI